MRTYRINEIFYSLQGEGRNTGRAAVFVRLSGCNLKCPFCDTDFSEYSELTAPEIVERMKSISAIADTMPMVVLTGGEPTLQADEALIAAIHDGGFAFVAMESNGTALPPSNLDWLTVSPKGKTRVERCNELKCLIDENGLLAYHDGITADYKYVQPCDTGDAERNALIIRKAVGFVEKHPSWRLSLQTHKLSGFK